MNRMQKRLAGSSLWALHAALLIAAVLTAIASSGESANLIFEKALGQSATNQTQAGGQNQAAQNITEQIKPIQERLDMAREALRNNDSTKALDEINAADTEIVTATQNSSP
jgi:hypothetical protein